MLGHKPRAPEERNLAVFRFVTKQSKESFFGRENQGEAQGLLPWPKLMESWNRENPDQEYTKESRIPPRFPSRCSCRTPPIRLERSN